MSEIKVRLRRRPEGWWCLPALNEEQRAVVEGAQHSDVIARGAPSSGRSTCALAVFEQAVARGHSALILAPDRTRADVLTPRAQALGPSVVRPVRTPASFAYQVVATWRTQREVPLEGVELVTGAAQDQLLAELLQTVEAPWPEDIGEQMRAMPAFRAELRNLVARVGEAGMDSEKLTQAGARFGHPEWEGAGAIVAALEEGPERSPEYPQTLRVDLSRIQSLAADLIGAWKRDSQARGGVPLAGGGRAFDFASQSTTRLLLDLVTIPTGESDTDVAIRRELAERLLPSALVGADALAVHRLLRRLNAARALAAEEAGDEAAVIPLTVADLVDDPDTWRPTLEKGAEAPGRRGWNDRALARVLTKAARMWELARQRDARPQERLWELWEACGVAEDWRSRAIRSDEASAWFDDQLDAVVALLRVADVWEQRNPAGSAVQFASELLSGSVPIDTISRVGVRPGGVEVLTPAQAMGRHWQVVVLAGLQDGAWPNMRLRDRILRADLLADVGAGRTVIGDDGREELIDSTRAARRAVLDDEYRLFVAAVTRSRCYVHAGAVRSEDAAPSVFFDLVARLAGTPRENDVVPLDAVEAPLSLPGHIADLRARAASSDDTVDAQLAATLLALMAREGITSAQPERWLGAGGTPTTDEECRGDVKLSPSQFERALACPLRWFLTTIGADGPSNAAASLGTLVHALAEENPHGTPEELTEALEARIEELGYNLDTWAGRHADRHARAIVDNLASYLVGVPGRVEVEQMVEAQVEGVTIRGRMDRLEHVDEGVRVTDLKTGKSGHSAKTVPDNPQLAAYQMALLASGKQVAGARIALLGGDKPKTFDQKPLEGKTLEEWRGKVREVAAIARGPYFEATPSDEACRYCSFDRLCPARERGRKVVE